MSTATKTDNKWNPMVPSALLRDPSLDSDCKVLAALLLDYARTNEECFPSEETLAAHMGCSVDKVQRHIRHLREKVRLDVKRANRRGNNRYGVRAIKEYRARSRTDAVSSKPHACGVETISKPHGCGLRSRTDAALNIRMNNTQPRHQALDTSYDWSEVDLEPAGGHTAYSDDRAVAESVDCAPNHDNSERATTPNSEPLSESEMRWIASVLAHSEANDCEPMLARSLIDRYQAQKAKIAA